LFASLGLAESTVTKDSSVVDAGVGVGVGDVDADSDAALGTAVDSSSVAAFWADVAIAFD
jgi:hypothetical protein